MPQLGDEEDEEESPTRQASKNIKSLNPVKEQFRVLKKPHQDGQNKKVVIKQEIPAPKMYKPKYIQR